MPEPSDETLAKWLSDVTVSIEPPEVKQYQAALTHVVNKLEGVRALDLVAMAHHAGDAAASEWLTTLVKEKKDDLIVGDKLLERLAAAALVKGLNPVGKAHVVLGLAVQSAEFVGLEPTLPEVSTFADAALRAAAATSRDRTKWQPVAPDIEGLLEGTEEIVNAQTQAVEQEADDGHADAIERLAKGIDQLGATLHDRLELVDEEYDSLWWSYTGRSETRKTPWAEVSPLSLRAVMIADELGSKVTRTPSPPIIPGLVGLALGDKRDKSVSIQEVARHATALGVRIVPDAKHRLLPISSAVAEVRRLGAEDETLWPQALMAATGIDASQETSALAAALQLIRENEIGSELV